MSFLMDNDSNSNSTNPDQQHVGVAHDFPGIIRVFKDGRVQRFTGTNFVPPSIHPQPQAAGVSVSSKDIAINVPQANIAARLFLPQLTHKLPLLVYFHGGAFCVSSPFTSNYHNYLTAVVAEAKVVAVSVGYRLASEHPIPAAYEDSWAALQWVASHRGGGGPEPWLNDHADFGRVFLAGDSAGANIVHNLAMVAGEDPGSDLGLNILGACLVHPFLWGSEPIGSEALDPHRKAIIDRLWPFVCPSLPDNDDPRVNPMAEGAPSLAWFGMRGGEGCVERQRVALLQCVGSERVGGCGGDRGDSRGGSCISPLQSGLQQGPGFDHMLG